MKKLARKMAAKMGMKMTMLYEGDLYATVETQDIYANSFGFLAKPDIRIEGVPDKILVVVNQPTKWVKKAIGNYWGPYVRKGDKVFMSGTLDEVELLHWGTKSCTFDCKLLFNETIRSGYGLRMMKKKKTYFKGQIRGTVTGLISAHGHIQLRTMNLSFESRWATFCSIGMKLEKNIEGLPEEITVHLGGDHNFSIGDEAIVDGEIYSVPLKDTNFRIYEMRAERYLNPKYNLGF